MQLFRVSGMNNHIFGFNIYSKPIEDLLDYTIDHNIKHIEIHPSKEHSSVESFNVKRIKNLLEITEENDISLSIHVPHNINISDIIYPIRKNHTRKLIQYFKLAERIKAIYITLHIGSFYWFPIEQKKRMSALKRFVKQIKQVLCFCEDHNIIIALENSVPIPQGSEYFFLGDNVHDFEFLFNEIDSENLGFCLDTGHANVAEGIEKYIKMFGHKIATIHYHDNNATNDEHLPVGEGNIRWETFSSLINQIGFNGPFISECRDLLPHEAAKKLSQFL